MKVAYFDCFSGISGDMCLGALVDAGAPFDELLRRLNTLDLGSYELKKGKVMRGGISATRVEVAVSGDVPPRRFSDIRAIIEGSGLSSKIKKEATAIFRRLFDAEAAIHGTAAEDLHLHELSATDCIIDIAGTLVCLDLLGIEEVVASPLNLGGGMVSTAHGLIPAPAPATLALLEGRPVYSSGIQRELTTPTGAAIITAAARTFGPMPAMTLGSTGNGAGAFDLGEQPNILRVFVGERTGESRTEGVVDERVTVIETNIDDMNPQVYEYVMEKLFGAGALDVTLSTVIMKKGRPGIQVQVLCRDESAEKITRLLFEETTTLGVRYHRAGRTCLQREVRKVDTMFGKVRFKTASSGGIQKASPEYEDCRKIAARSGVPLIEVLRRVRS